MTDNRLICAGCGEDILEGHTVFTDEASRAWHADDDGLNCNVAASSPADDPSRPPEVAAGTTGRGGP